MAPSGANNAKGTADAGAAGVKGVAVAGAAVGTPRRRLDRRLFVTFFSLAMLVFLASAAVVVGASWRVYEGNAETALQAQAELTAGRLAGLDPASMAARLQEPALAATRVTLVGGDGAVLYDSEADAATMASAAMPLRS